MTSLHAILGLQTSFWSAVAAYLASGHQRLLPKPVHPWLGWGAFTLGAVCSVALLAAVHDGLTAFVYWLCAVLLTWSLMVLVTPHRTRKGITLLCGASLMLVAALLQ